MILFLSVGSGGANLRLEGGSDFFLERKARMVLEWSAGACAGL
jgi:hypothetical protein